MFKPFTDNLVFFDTEFSSNEPTKGEILSFALVKMDGKELYLELEFEGELHPWVKSNVLPYLDKEKVSKAEAKQRIFDFIGDEKPYLMSYVNQYDFVYLMKILEYDDSPFQSTPLDFASVMYGLGYDPKEYTQRLNHKFIKELGIDVSKYHLHYALDDAKLLREVYLALK